MFICHAVCCFIQKANFRSLYKCWWFISANWLIVQVLMVHLSKLWLIVQVLMVHLNRCLMYNLLTASSSGWQITPALFALEVYFLCSVAATRDTLPWHIKCHLRQIIPALFATLNMIQIVAKILKYFNNYVILTVFSQWQCMFTYFIDIWMLHKRYFISHIFYMMMMIKYWSMMGYDTCLWLTAT